MADDDKPAQLHTVCKSTGSLVGSSKTSWTSFSVRTAENVRNAVRSLAALLRSRPLQPASPDLAERIIRKAKHIRQRVQTKPQKNSVVPEEATQKKENP